MATEYGKLFFLVVTIFLVEQIPGSFAQARMEFTGSIEFPSLKCIMKPQQFEFDVQNKTVCFCIWIQSTIPTWNCMKGDGKVTMDDLKELVGTIRNITGQFTPIMRGTTTTAPPAGTAAQQKSNSDGGGVMMNPFSLPGAQDGKKPKFPMMMLSSMAFAELQKDDITDNAKSIEYAELNK